MPYLGSSPARGLVGTDHIDASAVTTAKIATNAIDGTLTKDALIADYSDVTITASDLIMYGDATDSNNTKRDTVQGILDLAGGGQWTHVNTTVFDDTASWERTGLAADEWYKIIMMGIVHSTAGGPGLLVGHGSTPTYITSNYRWAQSGQNGAGAEDSGGTSGSRFDIYSATGDQSASYTANIEAVVYTGSGDAVRIPTCFSYGQMWEHGVGSPTTFTFAGGNVDSAFNSAAVSALKMDPISSGNFTYGEVQFFSLSN
tara:strand:+ start:337 stop:1110 length:774 start_codon:yes stop_codon:yes gene_type:complete